MAYRPCKCSDTARDAVAPMVLCDHCETWYHFDCVGLSESDAGDIASYVCPDCHAATGLRTVMEWEGEDALEEVAPPPLPPVASPKRTEQTSEDEPEDSADEYTEERVVKRRRLNPGLQHGHGHRNGHAGVIISDSDESEPEEHAARSRKPLKRKASAASAAASRAKRARSESSAKAASEDATRKYCTGKLLELLAPVFRDYHDWHEDGPAPKGRELPPDELQRSKDNAVAFVADLEHTMFEHYAEPDKNGNPHASGKYKERFRMLTFNLSKEDRVILRRRIVSGDLPADELANMSSTDLASEETKQAIEQVLKESLEHSILESRLTGPRSKMTHKGTEMIEDDETFAPPPPPPEPLHIVTHMRRDSMMSEAASTPSQQPPTPATPVLPTPHIGTANSSFVTSPTQRASSSGSYFVPSVPSEDDGLKKETDMSTTLASLATTSATPAFSLGDLWTGGDAEPVVDSAVDPQLLDMNPFNDVIDMDLTAPDDQDFDMFLEAEDPVASTSQGQQGKDAAPSEPAAQTPEQVAQAAYEALPVVYSGEFVMPDMVSCNVRCRHVGGRELAPGGSAWGQLFTAPKMRIDGRVPLPVASKYLVDSRLNPSRELIAVALSPAGTQDEGAFEALVDMLHKKERYGVSFPWGNPPPPTAPGKELYIVPLMPHQPLPESVELLDNVHIPQPHTKSMLLGVFVLHKGRVVDSPAATPAPAPVQPPLPPPVPVTQAPTPAVPLSVLSHIPTFAAQPYPPPPVPMPIPQYPGMPMPPPAFAMPPPPAPVSAPTAIPALTPEQISLMVRSLSHLTQGVPPAPTSQPMPFTPPHPPQGHAQPPFPYPPPPPHLLQQQPHMQHPQHPPPRPPECVRSSFITVF
ncbi:hypothetical protein AURDEDRAFT_86321, partial [Auricularia subglabra TFB-10046 SS5]